MLQPSYRPAARETVGVFYYVCIHFSDESMNALTILYNKYGLCCVNCVSVLVLNPRPENQVV
jgi:uncharacterized membrane protein